MAGTRQDWIVVGASLAAGNFFWQAMGGQHWDVAFERSYFQLTAVFIAWLFIGRRKIEGSDR